MSRIGVLRFPGTNCDQDVFWALEDSGHKAEWLWHEDSFQPEKLDGYVVPGGFSYGDYLRAGALASQSQAISDLKKADELGKPILGICNGFQILCESGLLEGALLKNSGGRFIDKVVEVKTHDIGSKWSLNEVESMKLPIAHGEGCFFADDETVKSLYDNNQVWLTYSDNPNGSVKDIAGISNKNKNVVALMPHPERAMKEWMGTVDGRRFFDVFN